MWNPSECHDRTLLLSRYRARRKLRIYPTDGKADVVHNIVALLSTSLSLCWVGGRGCGLVGSPLAIERLDLCSEDEWI